MKRHAHYGPLEVVLGLGAVCLEGLMTLTSIAIACTFLTLAALQMAWRWLMKRAREAGIRPAG